MIILLGLSICSAIAYRIGGKGGFKGAKLIRRLICPLCLLLAFWGLIGFKLSHIWLYLATYGLSVGAMSAYWSELQDPRDDVSTVEWFVTGLIYGLSTFPLIWCGIHWYGVILRAVVLGLITMFWSNNIYDVFWEEIGRGAFIVLSFPILLI